MAEQAAAQAAAKATVILGGRLIDATGAATLGSPVVVIEGKRISRIGKAGEFPLPEGAEVIDARGLTLMPGLFDCHVHIAAYNTVSFANHRIAMFEVSPQL